MQYQITSIEHLKNQLAELNDNLLLPWNTYPCLEWDRSKNLQGYGFAWTGKTNEQRHIARDFPGLRLPILIADRLDLDVGPRGIATAT